MPGPKADRLALLGATRTQFSPILAVYFDRSERYRHVMSRAWSDEWRARDEDGLLHTVAEVEPDDRLLTYLSRQRLYIADGHHRYETALAYQAEVRSDPALADLPPGELAADWIMAVLVNAEMEEIDIRPTHRLLRDGNPGAHWRNSWPSRAPSSTWSRWRLKRSPLGSSPRAMPMNRRLACCCPRAAATCWLPTRRRPPNGCGVSG